jgi:hypothetical protein
MLNKARIKVAELSPNYDGPVLEDVALDLEGAMGMADRLGKQVQKYQRHQRQFAVQRARVQQAENDLVPGHVLVIEDFVNQVYIYVYSQKRKREKER